MPLLDHFHPPLHPYHRWAAFYSNWATRIANALTVSVPEEFQVEEHVHAGPNLEIDIATHKVEEDAVSRNGGAKVQTLPAWTPAAPAHSMPAIFTETFEVRVFSTVAGLTLVGAIELISPANKDRADEREAFAIKCASYLHQGVSLIIIDVVTNRRANLHNEILRLMKADAAYEMSGEAHLYAVAYRPVLRSERGEIDIWPTAFSVGDRLPILPMRLTGDLFVPVDFEASYQEACRHRRLIS